MQKQKQTKNEQNINLGFKVTGHFESLDVQDELVDGQSLDGRLRIAELGRCEVCVVELFGNESIAAADAHATDATLALVDTRAGRPFELQRRQIRLDVAANRFRQAKVDHFEHKIKTQK